MPKPLKKPTRKAKAPAKPKRPSDPNRAAHAMLAEHMSRVQDETPTPPLDFKTQYRAHMRKLGKKGGKVGGKRRLETMTPEQRSDIASKAARAMWAKRRKQSGG
jgi:hypothetical protein